MGGPHPSNNSSVSGFLSLQTARGETHPQANSHTPFCPFVTPHSAHFSHSILPIRQTPFLPLIAAILSPPGDTFAAAASAAQSTVEPHSFEEFKVLFIELRVALCELASELQDAARGGPYRPRLNLVERTFDAVVDGAAAMSALGVLDAAAIGSERRRGAARLFTALERHNLPSEVAALLARALFASRQRVYLRRAYVAWGRHGGALRTSALRSLLHALCMHLPGGSAAATRRRLAQELSEMEAATARAAGMVPPALPPSASGTTIPLSRFISMLSPLSVGPSSEGAIGALLAHNEEESISEDAKARRVLGNPALDAALSPSQLRHVSAVGLRMEKKGYAAEAAGLLIKCLHTRAAKNELSELFDLLDMDGSGAIDVCEFKELLQVVCGDVLGGERQPSGYPGCYPGRGRGPRCGPGD